MNNKGISLIIGIVLLGFLYFFVSGEESSLHDVSVIDNNEPAVVKEIAVAHTFSVGKHSYIGEISLPTPCHGLKHEVMIAESFPEQVTIVFTTKSDAQECAQVTISEEFYVTFKADIAATVQMTLNGEKLPFYTIEPKGTSSEAMENESSSDLDDEEVADSDVDVGVENETVD